MSGSSKTLIDDTQALLFVGEGDESVEIIAYELGASVQIPYEVSLRKGDIVSVDVETEQLTKSRTKRVVTPVAIQEITQSNKGKSALGRGAVGAALLGPTGAILGAASGLDKNIKIQSNTKIVEHVSHEKEDYVEEGRSFLNIGIRNLQKPILRVEFLDKDEMKEWQVRFLMFKA